MAKISTDLQGCPISAQAIEQAGNRARSAHRHLKLLKSFISFEEPNSSPLPGSFLFQEIAIAKPLRNFCVGFSRPENKQISLVLVFKISPCKALELPKDTNKPRQVLCLHAHKRTAYTNKQNQLLNIAKAANKLLHQIKQSRSLIFSGLQISFAYTHQICQGEEIEAMIAENEGVDLDLAVEAGGAEIAAGKFLSGLRHKNVC